MHSSFWTSIQYFLTLNGFCLSSLSAIFFKISYGGNLSILCSLLNSNSFPKTKGNILLIEDVGEYLYSIDRMIYSLKRSGVFENISGLIVGKFSKTKDNKPSFGQNIHEIIIQALSEYNFPICFDFPFGHVKNNKPLLLFKNVQLQIRKSVQLIYTN